MNNKLESSRIQRPIDFIYRPLEQFAHEETSGGIVLLLAALAALLWANSPWADAYLYLWHTHLTIGVGAFSLSKPLELWVNDGLMAIFFFVVGLEIKREFLLGELSSTNRAVLPIAAALGGMIVPAAIYGAINLGKPEISGWGVPMATDIAFALGIVSLLGKRVPASLKVFLAALAIVDDLGAVLVIAFFYSSGISWPALAAAAFFLLLMAGANWARIRATPIYGGLGILLWFALLKSGVHATIAGVLAAMTIPVRTLIAQSDFISYTHEMADSLDHISTSVGNGRSAEQHNVVQSIKRACHFLETPLHRMERSLHPWVAFLIMPVFALANAGIRVEHDLGTTLLGSSSAGIIAGLVLGKQAGILAFSWLAIKAGFASLPPNVTWRQVWGIGWVAGVGFTMAIFIADLAFEEALLNAAKAGILVASFIAGLAGYMILRTPKIPRPSS
jgi:NhaA family Na+:H+ antiporter